jgi:hypothetical protein
LNRLQIFEVKKKGLEAISNALCLAKELGKENELPEWRKK